MAGPVSAQGGSAAVGLRHDRVIPQLRDIVAWGKHRLAFLRRFFDFHHGIPCERPLRALVNRVDPVLFGNCFNSWIAANWPDRHEFIANDCKILLRTHDRPKRVKALHTLSA